MSALRSRGRQNAINWAQMVLESDALIVDFETTGLRNAQIVQIGVIDTRGAVKMDSLIRPKGPIPPSATRIHGINDSMVVGAPTFREVFEELTAILDGRLVVAYNSAYEEGVVAGECRRHNVILANPLQWTCAMKAYAGYWGDWNPRRRSYTWQSLTKACYQQDIPITGAHSAVGDCRLTLALIYMMAS